ncbi:MAG TPA: septum formation initiator family protein [Candidatus Limnocylindria bacterium]|nr:septum formation initiator family protein [Candidatus Limnocylindria bacterium]
MTGVETSAQRSRPSRNPRLTLPASRGGIAWLVVLLVIGGFLAFQVGRQVYASWSINQEADRVRAEIAALEAENAKLQRELKYLSSDAFISAEIRRLRNVGRPGERVLIIPPGSEAAPPPAAVLRTQDAPPPLEQWMQLFFGR